MALAFLKGAGTAALCSGVLSRVSPASANGRAYRVGRYQGSLGQPNINIVPPSRRNVGIFRTEPPAIETSPMVYRQSRRVGCLETTNDTELDNNFKNVTMGALAASCNQTVEPEKHSVNQHKRSFHPTDIASARALWRCVHDLTITSVLYCVAFANCLLNESMCFPRAFSSIYTRQIK